MCRVYHTRALAQWIVGHCEAARHAWERAASYVTASGDGVAFADMLAWIASSLPLGPEPVPRAVRRCEELLKDTPGYLSEAFILRPLGLLHALGGDDERSLDAFARARRILVDTGESIASVSVHLEAEAALVRGDAVAAEKLLRNGTRRLRAMGDRSLLSLSIALLASALQGQGRADEAFDLTLECEALAAREDVSAQVHWRAVRARILMERGLLADAMRLAQEGVDQASSTDWLVGRGNAACALAATLAAHGADDGAYQGYSEALSLYERKGATVLSAGARAAMARLAPKRACSALRRPEARRR
jgi:hypothetical protein